MNKLIEFINENPNLNFDEKRWLTLYMRLELKWKNQRVCDLLELEPASVTNYVGNWGYKLGEAKNKAPAIAYLFPITEINQTQAKEVKKTKEKTKYQRLCDRLDRIALQLEINGYDEDLVNERNNILVDKKRIEDEPKYKESKALIINVEYHGI